MLITIHTRARARTHSRTHTRCWRCSIHFSLIWLRGRRSSSAQTRQTCTLRPQSSSGAAAAPLNLFTFLFFYFIFFGVCACVVAWTCKVSSGTERSRGEHGQIGNLYSTNALYIYSSSLVWNWRAAPRVRKTSNFHLSIFMRAKSRNPGTHFIMHAFVLIKTHS